jgi:hypothetical protein
MAVHGHVKFLMCRGNEAIVRFGTQQATLSALRALCHILPQGSYVCPLEEKTMFVYDAIVSDITWIKCFLLRCGIRANTMLLPGNRLALYLSSDVDADFLMQYGSRWLAIVPGVVNAITISAAAHGAIDAALCNRCIAPTSTFKVLEMLPSLAIKQLTHGYRGVKKEKVL